MCAMSSKMWLSLFVITAMAYFALLFKLTYKKSTRSSTFYNKYIIAVLKASPIVALLCWVWFHGTNSISPFIFYGLLFSLVGDIFLVWQENGYFIHGMIAFGIAHILYITAFGFEHLRPDIGLPWVVAAALVYSILYPGLPKKLKGPVFIYEVLIATMGWRASVTYMEMNVLSESATTAAFVGSMTFGISDAILGINKFRYPYQSAHFHVMLTYYTGQFLIALSTM